MEQNRIDNYIRKMGLNPKQRIERDNGGQYLKNFMLEFSKFVADETLIEVQREIKKMRGK